MLPLRRPFRFHCIGKLRLSITGWIRKVCNALYQKNEEIKYKPTLIVQIVILHSTTCFTLLSDLFCRHSENNNKNFASDASHRCNSAEFDIKTKEFKGDTIRRVQDRNNIFQNGLKFYRLGSPGYMVLPPLRTMCW